MDNQKSNEHVKNLGNEILKKFLFLIFVFLLVGIFSFFIRKNSRSIDYPPKNYLKESEGRFEHLPFRREIEMDEKNNYFMLPFVGSDGQENILRIIGSPYWTSPTAFYVDVLKKNDPNVLQLPSYGRLVFSPPIVNSFVDLEDLDHFKKDLATIHENPVEEIKGKGFHVKVKKISADYFLPKGLEAIIAYKWVKFEIAAETK